MSGPFSLLAAAVLAAAGLNAHGAADTGPPPAVDAPKAQAATPDKKPEMVKKRMKEKEPMAGEMKREGMMKEQVKMEAMKKEEIMQEMMKKEAMKK